MSEHDPIHDLESFGTGGVTMTPIAPSDVRRLGDRRRTRRRATVATVSVAAVLAAVVPFVLTSGGHDDGDSAPPIVSTPTQSTSPSPPPTPTEITFPNGGIQVNALIDTDKLEGTTEAFKTFIAHVWQIDADSGCASPQVVVQKYSSRGYARGSVGGCSGYVALWVLREGRWAEALGTQDEWQCDDLARFAIPQSFAGDCYWPPFGPHAVDGLRIGMTPEEITAAGGTVLGDPGDDCRGVVMPGFTKVSQQDPFAALVSRGRLALVFAGKDVRTPEGVARGSTEAEVRAAFPQGHLNSHNYWIVPIDAGSEYSIGLNGAGHLVSEIAIQTTGRQYCVG